ALVYCFYIFHMFSVFVEILLKFFFVICTEQKSFQSALVFYARAGFIYCFYYLFQYVFLLCYILPRCFAILCSKSFRSCAKIFKKVFIPFCLFALIWPLK